MTIINLRLKNINIHTNLKGDLNMDISELLIFAQEQGASDIHISAEEPPIIRLHGELRKLEMDKITKR